MGCGPGSLTTEFDIPTWDIPTWDIPTWDIPTWDIPTWDIPTWDIPTFGTLESRPGKDRDAPAALFVAGSQYGHPHRPVRLGRRRILRKRG